MKCDSGQMQWKATQWNTNEMNRQCKGTQKKIHTNGVECKCRRRCRQTEWKLFMTPTAVNF